MSHKTKPTKRTLLRAIERHAQATAALQQGGVKATEALRVDYLRTHQKVKNLIDMVYGNDA